MPEIRFRVAWPNGQQELCYSPSLVVKEYFTPGTTYSVADFVARAETALTIASDRVKAKYGFACGLALGQLDSIKANAQQFEANDPLMLIEFVE